MVSPLNSLVAGLGSQRTGLENIGGQIQGLRAGEQQIALQEQALQRGERAVQAEDRAMQAEDQAMQSQQAIRQVKFINALGKKMLETDESQWGQLLEPNLGALSSLGFDVNNLANLNRQQVEAAVAQTDAVIGEGEAQSVDSVQSSEILPGGGVIKVMKSGNVVVEDQQGNPLTGAERQNAINEAEERGIGLKVDAARRVATATKEAGRESKKIEEQEKNVKVYDTYNAAIGNLSESLGGTSSGIIFGSLPATTTNQQIAESAIALVRPTLKSLFRESGEGTFTEGDQKLLDQLIPRRSQTREAQMANLKAIDVIVRAKLGIPSAEDEVPAESPAQPADQSPQQAPAEIFTSSSGIQFTVE
jgi:hypothetical protein